MTTEPNKASAQHHEENQNAVPYGLAPKWESIGNIHDGSVVSISGDRLVLMTREGKRFSFRVATDAKVCCDGVPCKAQDLKVGRSIRLTTDPDSKNVVNRIESIVEPQDEQDTIKALDIHNARRSQP